MFNTFLWPLRAAVFIALATAYWPARAAEIPGTAQFRQEVQPIFAKYCSDCHLDGMKKGEVAFDELKSDQALLENHVLWAKVLKNLRAGIMPPEKKPRPTAEETKQIENWVKTAVFKIDPKNPDPGAVTVRRLNRVEYRNTIRDLIGIDFNTESEFPPDDTGHGFDNIADVLTLSPMLLEKYLDAAKTIVSRAVPRVSAVPAEKTVAGGSFRRTDASEGSENVAGPLSLSYYQQASASNTFKAEHAGRYQLVVDLTANEKYVDNQFDLNRCRLVFKVDGQELLKQEFAREGSKPFRYEFDRDWKAGNHTLALEVEPLTPEQRQSRSLTLRINSVTVRGPFDEKYFVRPKNYERFFPRSEVPQAPEERRAYARELLGPFATKAFRRPVDNETIDRLVALAEKGYSLPRQTFEAGVAQAMVAVLASPRFLFREETIEAATGGMPADTDLHPFVDEYSLASRLSYFLWASMPDDELFRLASKKQLRKNLSAQIKRMLADPRAEALIQNFSGQWLQARDIETVQIDARSVLRRDDGTGTGGRGRGFGFGFFRPRADLTPELRKAMRRETEMYFGYVVQEDRSVLELIHSDYTFLNESLAKHYGLTNLTEAVTGPELRRVTLPPDSPRGGVLTHGTVLAVTSNPTRTSPVKRGLFVLDNILGIATPPPPPDIPTLEDVGKESTNRTLTLRETLALHREKPLCASCHNRMDPLGLALENFNAMGMWREKELGQPIDAAGKLITGEPFKDIREVKQILATEHRAEFYRTLTEKLLTYALGRGLEFYDVETVDRIVERLDKENGRFSALLAGVIESAPFQKRRNPATFPEAEPSKPVQQRAELKVKL